jgi:hypothetical protein
MTRSAALWRPVAHGAALVGILAVAALVLHTTPDRELQHSPFRVQGSVGEPTSGRNILATVHSATRAEAVTAGNGWAGGTPGVWVVIDLSVQNVVDDVGAGVGTAVLRVGDTRFSASTRPDRATVAGMGLATGIPLSGPLFFELPDDVASSPDAANAVLEMAANSDPRVDSMLSIPVDLLDDAVLATLDTDFPEWGAR